MAQIPAEPPVRNFDESRLVGKVVRRVIKFNSLPVYILPFVDTAKQNVWPIAHKNVFLIIIDKKFDFFDADSKDSFRIHCILWLFTDT
jgi:hypothetical protein